MKRVFIYMFLIPQLVMAKSTRQQLESDLKNGIITYQDFLVNTALSIYDPALLPARYTIETTIPEKSGTFIASQIKRHWAELNSEHQALLKSYISRPELKYSVVSPSGQFRIHYDMTGIGGVSPVDVNPANNIPDYVDAVMESFDYSHHIQTSVIGFNPPPKDNGEGGGDEFDIYIRNFSRIYGQTSFEAALPDDETRYISYIEIDNNYYGFPTSGLDGMRVTSAHEYFHAIQFGYKFLPDEDLFWENEVFFYEISSTWMEDMIYDEVNDYYFYLDNFFKDINKPFDTYDGSYEYGNCLWNHMLTKKYGATIIKDIWTKLVDYPALDAVDRTLQEYGSSFYEELIDYSIWNYYTGSRADTVHYYDEGPYYDEVVVELDHVFSADMRLDGQSAQLSYSYFRFHDPETGNSAVLIPINLEDNTGILSDFSLEVSRLQSKLFTSLTENLKARLIVENRFDWLGRAIISNDDGHYSQVALEAVDPKMIETEDIVLNFGPNPFKPEIDKELHVSYQVNEPGPITIVIFREDGSVVRKFKFDDVLSGINSFSWKAAELGDFPGGCGIYFLLIHTEKGKQLIKFAIIR